MSESLFMQDKYNKEQYQHYQLTSVCQTVMLPLRHPSFGFTEQFDGQLERFASDVAPQCCCVSAEVVSSLASQIQGPSSQMGADSLGFLL
jgi:hypothetical protein